MFRKLLSLATSVTSFLPGSVATRLNAKIEARPRHMEVICSPRGFPARIDWDLSDAPSVIQAKAQIEYLKQFDHRRSFFVEKAPGELGKRLRNPSTEENMISMPEIYAG